MSEIEAYKRIFTGMTVWGIVDWGMAFSLREAGRLPVKGERGGGRKERGRGRE
jgi:hypothetical protein